MTTASGATTAVSCASDIVSASSAEFQISAATSSPAAARAITSFAPSGATPVASRYRRAIAPAEATASRQPRAPQAQIGPSAMGECPISPAYPPAVYGTPPTSRAPAMPVPMTSTTASA